MAEERLIDDDEDKNYRLKRNGDGSVSADGGEMLFEADDGGYDEEAALMTPEQYALKLEKEKREKEERKEKLDALIESAVRDIGDGKYSTALEYLLQAEEIDGGDGRIYALRLRAYTRGFTDYGGINEAAKCADKIELYCTAEQKAQMRAAAGNALNANIQRLSVQTQVTGDENERGKAERAVKFKKDRNKALILFGCLFAAAIVFIALCIHFALIIRTVPTDKYLIITCVFAGVAALFLIASAFAGRYLSTAWRRVILNKRDSSTSLGRKLIEMRRELASFEAVRKCLEEKQ